MERIEYRGVVDKSGWAARGPWDREPDKIQWKDETTGLPCLIVRGPSGALCGYVGVDDKHPLHGLDYGACPLKDCPDRTGDRSWCDHTPESTLNAHGGITFADACQPGAKEDRGICHKPAPGEPDHVWWFGFDCAHAGDFGPKYDRPEYLGQPTGWGSHNKYRDIAYVEGECRDLAKQLHAISSPERTK